LVLGSLQAGRRLKNSTEKPDRPEVVAGLLKKNPPALPPGGFTLHAPGEEGLYLTRSDYQLARRINDILRSVSTVEYHGRMLSMPA
jgi:hypothetical protein